MFGGIEQGALSGVQVGAAFVVGTAGAAVVVAVGVGQFAAQHAAHVAGPAAAIASRQQAAQSCRAQSPKPGMQVGDDSGVAIEGPRRKLSAMVGRDTSELASELGRLFSSQNSVWK